MGIKSGIAKDLAGISGILCLTGKADHAAQLLGASESLLKSGNVSLNDFERKILEDNTTKAIEELGEHEFRIHFEEGRSMGIDEAIELALSQHVSRGSAR